MFDLFKARSYSSTAFTRKDKKDPIAKSTGDEYLPAPPRRSTARTFFVLRPINLQEMSVLVSWRSQHLGDPAEARLEPRKAAKDLGKSLAKSVGKALQSL